MRIIGVILLGLLVVGLGAWAERPQFGPYLIYPGNPDEMMVLWNSRTTRSAILRWGLDETCSSGEMICEGDKAQRMRLVSDMYFPGGYDYRVTLGDLAPATTYYYEVETSGHTVSSTFRTAPSPEQDTLRFLAWADTQYASQETCGYPPCCFGDTAHHALEHVRQDPSLQTLMLHAGDWVADPLERSWKQFLQNSSNRELMSLVPQQGCMGNHDTPAVRNAGDSYAKYMPYPYVDDHYWSFDYGPLHVVVIDQFRAGMCDVSDTSDQEQIEWIREDLEANDRPWTIALFHMPQNDGDTGGPEVHCHRMRSALDPDKVDLLLAGHWHSHHFFTHLWIPQLIMGSASDRHNQGGCMYYLFDISGDVMTIDVYESGVLLESIRMENT